MTTLLEKGQFVTIEFFTDEDQEERYEDGDRDFYFIHELNDETIEEAILAILEYTTHDKVYVSVVPRRYAEVVIEDNEIEEVVDYGDSTLGIEDYIYNRENNLLLSAYDYELIFG